jgi:hypothetical protein
MRIGKSRPPTEVWQEVDGQPDNLFLTEEPLLMIDELEPRLTPDGWGGNGHSNNNNPPGGQVGWGC